MTSTITPMLVGGLGGMELLIILAVLVLLFGASKLPDLARGSGQALRIFKAETKGLMDGNEKDGNEKDGDEKVAPAAVSEPIVSETPHEHGAPRA
ncbi:sec-independent protein translocase protein TatA [Nocardioides sp. BE266]|uniref:twin-arginine translocase TatA/TatE family subunit n=1 Tax=Nocardioides sp. BE266 TaxID=2817725 RepID=UPI0028586BEC|nr:twin-arginine translocase TatA/TatE family subunit [Nocardioides sp. BE266]MDR7254777.1 sec-independent protein translocase protein TatA [Nocardioides sp. BE266]